MTITITHYYELADIGAGTVIHWSSDFIGPIDPASWVEVGQYVDQECTQLMFTENHLVSDHEGDVRLQCDLSVDHTYGRHMPLPDGNFYVRVRLHSPAGQVDEGLLWTTWASFEGQSMQIMNVMEGMSRKLDEVIRYVSKTYTFP